MDERYIASLDLLAVHPAGHRTPFSLRVGAPERAPEGEWVCAMRLDDLFEELVPMRGADSVQALCLALGLAEQLLRGFVAEGGRLNYSGTEEDWPLEAYFRWIGDPQS